jgi:hypothetical protein
MVRPHSQNLASPISDFAPSLNAKRNHPKTGKTVGGFLNPPTMELEDQVMLKHQKCPL